MFIYTLLFPGCEELGVEKCQAKIIVNNLISISMFQKMGFEKVKCHFHL